MMSLENSNWQSSKPAWSDEHPAEAFKVVRVPMPVGSTGLFCPQCQAMSVVAVIAVRADGSHVIPSSDEQDPDLQCTDCGFWWD